MAAAIAEFEPLRLLVADDAMAAAARETILAVTGPTARLDRIEFTTVATNDSWIRDHGPIFVNRAAPADAPRAARAGLRVQFVGRKVWRL